ncbi:MAG: prepilin-type N-terminal cleavage/methylation domain-containing protein [Phycisphaerales bacterium]|nr:prepilin-type N-terminal cleavage/methylation domain-containing protein [Phycisphaerales bacterium]
MTHGHSRPRPAHRRCRGFTLVEAIATIAVISAISIVAARVLSTSTSLYTQTAARAELHVQLSTALDRITSELRQCRIRPSSSPVAPDVTGTTASSITWIGPDGVTDAVSLSGSTLLWQVPSGGTATLATGVTAFTVQCYNESNAALASTLSGSGVDAIRRVEITITGSLSGVTETLRTRVFLRAMVVGGASS